MLRLDCRVVVMDVLTVIVDGGSKILNPPSQHWHATASTWKLCTDPDSGGTGGDPT
jgi:hypothetical protein